MHYLQASVTSVQLAEENARATALESQIATAHEATADMAGEVRVGSSSGIP
jgi:hypothetical protein